jgi:hypothetical protein
MITERMICGRRVLAECAPEHMRAAQDILAELAASGRPLEEGQRVRFGWSLLTLRAEGEGLRVWEPDFAGDSENGLSPTLDTTIAIIDSQLKWLRLLGEDGLDASFDQRVVLAKAALAAPNIFALRSEPNGEIDSGWSVAPVPRPGEQIDMSGLETTPIHRLLAARPGLLAVLALPVGYLVTLSGNDVVEVTAPDGAVTAVRRETRKKLGS